MKDSETTTLTWYSGAPTGSAKRVLVTGAAGGVGTILWPRLAERGYSLRLFDRLPVPGVEGRDPHLELRVGDLARPADLTDALSGIDAVVHLAGNAGSGDWPTLIDLNIDATRTLYEAAAAAGVRKIAYASSCHAAGWYDQNLVMDVDPRWSPRPCCKYGASKAACEVIGRFFSDHYGLQVINLRLSAMGPHPYGRNGMSFWLSYDDLTRAVAASIEAEVDFGTYYAVSANTQRRWNIEVGNEIGFVPLDDAEGHSEEADLTVQIASCYNDIPSNADLQSSSSTR